MTGAEHQSQAETLLAEWWKNRNDSGRGQQFMPWLAAAQAHATLALAAATEAASAAAQSSSAHPDTGRHRNSLTEFLKREK